MEAPRILLSTAARQYHVARPGADGSDPICNAFSSPHVWKDDTYSGRPIGNAQTKGWSLFLHAGHDLNRLIQCNRLQFL